MSYNTIPAEVSRYKVVLCYHANLQNEPNFHKYIDVNENRPEFPLNTLLMSDYGYRWHWHLALDFLHNLMLLMQLQLHK